MTLKDQMEAIYTDLSRDQIPWNLEAPPDLLAELVETERVLPCQAVDLGCGTGSYTVWLASKGFLMTGLDFSAAAISLAKQRAIEKGVPCNFVTADLKGDLGEFEQSFDFAYDWEVLHHVFPHERQIFIQNVHRLLRAGGRYVSVCFSVQDSDFGGQGKVRTTPMGTALYFSSEDELRGLLSPTFHIEELYTSEIAGKYGPHKVVVAIAKRK